jgi:hypothetical protein
MPIFAEKKELKKWLQEAQFTDVTYHRSRQQLWAKLIKCMSSRGDLISIDRNLWNSIKSVLTSRSQDMNDTKKLAFDTALQELDSAVEGVVADDDDEKADDSPRLPGLVKKDKP